MEFLVRCTNGTCQAKTYTPPPAPAGVLALGGSVGQGGANRPDDVRAVQEALNRVPPTAGGPTPPLAVDGKVGPLTTGAISRFQQKQLGWSDGRVDTNNKTIAKLREFQAASPAGKANPAAGAGGGPAVPHNPFVMPLVYARLQDSLRWIHAAERTVTAARDLLGGGPQTFTLETNKKAFALVNKYFHLEKLPPTMRMANLNFMHKVYTDMRAVIAHVSPDTLLGSGIFQEDPTADNRPDGPNLAFTFYGGWHQRGKLSGGIFTGPSLRQDSIFIATDVLGQKNDEAFTNTIVHELAHFVGPGVNSPHRIADHSYRFQANFLKLDSFTAMRTAECYNMLAGEAFLRREPVEFNV